MPLRKSLFVAIVAPVLALSSSAIANAPAIGVIDRVFAAIKQGILPPGDIQILEHAAEGKLEETDVAVILSLGIKRIDFVPLTFRSFDVRVHAFRKIGEIGLPEGLEYLSGITVAKIGEDTTQKIWPAARIGLHVALLNNIADRDAQIAFLRKAMVERDTGFIDGAVHNWAIDELCNRGDSESLPAISQYLHRVASGKYGDEQVRDCQKRMEVVSSDPDRVKALASVLRLGDPTPDLHLVFWAVAQLSLLHSPEANRELVRFSSEIASLPPNSPTSNKFHSIQENIRIALSQNP